MAYNVEKAEKMPISKVLASNAIKELAKNINLTPEQIRKAASNAMRLSADPKLSRCDSYSLVKFCYETARYDFVRDDSIYPVPYGNSVQAQLSYKGYIEIAMRSGKYKDIGATAVTKADTIKVNPLTGKAEVVFCDDYEKRVGADEIGYYAYAIGKDGSLVTSLYMSKEEAMKHGKRYSKSFSTLWTTDFDKMAKKTVIKQMYKDLDVTPLMAMAIKTDQYCFGGENTNGGYFDNPANHDTIDISSQEDKKTTVRNSISKPKDEPKDKPSDEAKEDSGLTDPDEDISSIFGFDAPTDKPGDDDNPF